MQAKLRCRLFPGQFSSELVAVVKSASGPEYSLFAQKTEIEYSNEPDKNGTDGWLRVEVVDRGNGLCIVRLPYTTLENGQFLKVRANDLEMATSEQKAVG